MENNVVKVNIWGHTAGYIVWDKAQNAAVFEYDPAFLSAGLDIAPTTMPLDSPRTRKGLPWVGDRDKLYQGLPPMLADSLPDKWGDTVFARWLAEERIPARSVTPVDRLSYIGSRGMGALEYEPAKRLGKESFGVDVEKLYDFSREILAERDGASISMNDPLLWQDLVKVGTSAGGRRPKALVAINDTTGEVRSGQTDAPEGFRHYILKFGSADGYPYSAVEYVYSMMAGYAGIRMMPCRLAEFGGVPHFLTERFDRDGNERIHTQTLAAMAPGAADYNDAFSLMRTLKLPAPQQEQLLRIMAFNVLAGNVDDHNKNISFCMDSNGVWSLAPAYDLTFNKDLSAPAYMNRQSMAVNGKTDGITEQDLLAVADRNGITGGKALIAEVKEAVSMFMHLALANGVEIKYAESIRRELNPDAKK